MSDPRTELRDRIADAIPYSLISTPAVGLGDARRQKIADAVMELFADVRCSEWLRPGYAIAELAEPSTPPEETT